jgi:hypothetical protein
MMLFPPLVPAVLLAVNVTMPITAAAPAAATNDSFFGDMLTDCISKAPKSALSYLIQFPTSSRAAPRRLPTLSPR